MTAVSLLNNLHWWQALLTICVFAGAVAGVVSPVFRAIAVVIVAWCVKADIAKLAIPLVLRPLRPNVFVFGKRNNSLAGRKKDFP